MNLWQIIGVQCRHTYLSRPMRGERQCVECGQHFTFTSYAIAPEERHTIEHYTVKDKSIRRVANGLLRFRQRKEGMK